MQISLVQNNTMPRTKKSRFREQERLPDNLCSFLDLHDKGSDPEDLGTIVENGQSTLPIIRDCGRR